jgi:hypothetical protein
MLRRRWLRKVTKRQVIVHTSLDQSFQGILDAVYDDGLVLRAAVLRDGSPNGLALPGETFVPRETIAFCQLDG